MNVSVSTGKSPQTQAVAGSTQKQERLQRVNEANFERFKEIMPDGKLNADSLQILRELQAVDSGFNKKLQFIIDRESEQVLINVIDAETGKVIKILPPKELQRLSRRARGNSGLLLDESV
ncbi:MAG: flagellar protein FlaG [Spirochaetaceae bacterium]|jgi:flagellar protein FlaG|nr:flagellar protein FlaG [Spirochaetaceae bacterium]